VRKKERKEQSKPSRDEQAPPPKRRGKSEISGPEMEMLFVVISYASARDFVKKCWYMDRDKVLQFRQGMNDEICYLQMKEEKERKKRENSEADMEARKKAESASM
jgi:hypothetical protein